MRSFTVKSIKGEVIIYELEVRTVLSTEKDFNFNLKHDEYMAYILKPESFHMKREKIVNGKNEVYYEPDVWCWHSLYDKYEDALLEASKLVESEFAFNLRKYGTPYTDVDVASAMMCIKLEKLPDSTFMTTAELLAELLKLNDSWKSLTASEFAAKAKAAGHDSLGLCCNDPEQEVIFEELKKNQE